MYVHDLLSENRLVRYRTIPSTVLFVLQSLSRPCTLQRRSENVRLGNYFQHKVENLKLSHIYG